MFSKCIIKDGIERGSLLSMTTERYDFIIKLSRKSNCIITKYSTDGQRCLVAFNYNNQQFDAWFYTDQVEKIKTSCFEGGDYKISLQCECGTVHILDKYQHKDTISKNWICSKCKNKNNNRKNEVSYFHSQHTRSGADNSYWQIGDKRVYTS